MTGSADDALDVVQDAFVQAFLKLDTFRRTSAFYTWLYRIAFNVAATHRRRKKPTASVEVVRETSGEEPTDDQAGPVEQAEREERRRLVQAAIARLSDEHRKVLVLREIDGCCYETIAEVLDLPIGTVRSRLHRARLQLKEELKENINESLCLIPEDTNEEVKLGARGRYVMEITVTGRSAHGATPECGINAIDEAAKIVNGLKELPLNSHPKLGCGSICVLKIHGGGDSLSVPDRCKVRVDRHTVFGEDKKQVRNDFEELLKKMNLKCSYELSWMKRETPFLEPYILDANNPWAVKFLSSYKEFYKKEPEVTYGKSVGDFNAFGILIPIIVFGPKGENVHGPNECVYLDSIKMCRDFYLKFLNEL